MKKNLDVEKNLRSIGLKAKNALKKCDKKIGDIAESMGLPSDVVLRTMDATSDVRMMHMDTLIRLFHACGYTVDISITEKPVDDSDAPPVKPRKKKNDVPVVKFKDEIADPKEIAKREKAEARKKKSKKKVGTSRSKKKKVTR